METTLPKSELTFPYHEIEFEFNGREVLVHKPMYKVLDASESGFQAEYTGVTETNFIPLEAFEGLVYKGLYELLSKLEGYQKEAIHEGAEGTELDTEKYCEEDNLHLSLSFLELIKDYRVCEQKISGYFTFGGPGRPPITSFELDLLNRKVVSVNHIDDWEIDELPEVFGPMFKDMIEISGDELELYKAVFLHISGSHHDMWGDVVRRYPSDIYKCLDEIEGLVPSLEEIEPDGMLAARFNRDEFNELLPLLQDYLLELQNENKVQNKALCQQYIDGLKSFAGKEDYEGTGFEIGHHYYIK